MLEALTLDQLRVLVAVADEGSFGKAARALGRVQGSISYHVASLEGLLGLTLFERSGRRRPTLTAEGAALLAEARGVLGRMDGLRDTAAAIAEGLEPRLTLSVDSLFPAHTLSSTLSQLREAYPTVQVQLRSGILGAVIEDVVDGQSDLGIAGAPNLSESLARRPSISVELVPVVAPSHPLAGLGRPVRDQELAQHVHILLSSRADHGESMRGFESNHPWRVDDLHTRRELLLAGLGWSRMPRDRVEADLRAGRLETLDVARWPGRITVQLYAIHRRAEPLGPGARWLVDHLSALAD